MDEKPQVNWGLEGVYVAETRIAHIDSVNGALYYRGYDVADLVNSGATFEEVAYLLLHGKLPSSEELLEFQRNLATERELEEPLVGLINAIPRKADPMDALRAVISVMGTFDPEAGVRTREADMRRALRILSKAPTAAAYFHRVRNSLPLVKPRGDLDHVSNYFHMFFGREPTEREWRALNTLFIIYAEHGMNNSTFTAVTVASTWVDLYSTVVAAISSLKGPLHGAANMEAMKMLLEVGEPARAEDYVVKTIERGGRIMGFGHRLYKKITDPRVSILKELARKLSEEKGGTYRKIYETAEAMEKAVAKHLGNKGIAPNTDLYAAVIYYQLGFPIDYYPVNFALSRITGWAAHVIEYIHEYKGRLIRPLDHYTGQVGLKYTPIEKRK
jgi:citrate synthase